MMYIITYIQRAVQINFPLMLLVNNNISSCQFREPYCKV